MTPTVSYVALDKGEDFFRHNFHPLERFHNSMNKEKIYLERTKKLQILHQNINFSKGQSYKKNNSSLLKMNSIPQKLPNPSELITIFIEDFFLN